MTRATNIDRRASLRSRAADVLWRRRSTKGRVAVVAAAVVVFGAISDAGGSGDAAPTTPPSSTTTAPATTAPPTTEGPATTAPPTTEAPATTAPPTTAPPTTAAPTAAPSALVARVVDGDTVEMADGTRVRLIGIDTPEKGECGYAEAAEMLSSLVKGVPVTLRGGARDDSDHYGRLLRYIDTPSGDANLEMIRSGWARARYDSRDGYGRHEREDAYVAADRATPHRCGVGEAAAQAAPPPPPAAAPAAPSGGGTDPKFRTCKDAKAAGYGPYRRGVDPEYSWYRDQDGDGLVCE